MLIHATTTPVWMSLGEPLTTLTITTITTMTCVIIMWSGRCRMFYNGQNTQMPESCVNFGMCGTYYPLTLNGTHPQLEDGVVTRQVCLSAGGNCCDYTSHPIRVKACPGDYYVYEFVKPTFCGAYCAGEHLDAFSLFWILLEIFVLIKTCV